MASTSASKLMEKPSYDVFINHRGPDVKSTLATALYGMLTGMALSVFWDAQELEHGDFLPPTIEAAMRSALLYIAIFSKSYAESPRCLAELSLMLETGTRIIPIFYDVDPSDLRWVEKGKGVYDQAFKEHEQKGGYPVEELLKWKKALHIVSFYTGEVIKSNDDEWRPLKKIRDWVVQEINVPLEVANHPVGLEEVVKDFEMNIFRSDQSVQIIGIWGMGGSGKTTLAKELYNRKSSLIKKRSFVSDIREASTKGLLYKKQKEILENLRVQNVPFDNIEEGMRTLARHLRSVRVLIVLDDVGHVDQLNALLPAKDKLEWGSLILVTTREYDVLKSWGITSIYKMKALDPYYAKQLFCWHAFIQASPQEGFKELVEIFSEACHGLPLSLKVIGAQLYGKSDKEDWKSLLHQIMGILPFDIQKILKISYDSLDDEEKEMFLDAACFFIGEDCSLAIEIWNGLRWSGLLNWEKLLHRCLVELDDDNCIRMHDHIRDMGKDISNKQSPYRLCFPQQCINIQREDEKEKLPEMAEVNDESGKVDEARVRCSHGELMVNTNEGIWSLSPSLVGLKFLVISGDSFNDVLGEVSRKLVWLRWFQIGQRNLSPGLSLKNLRVLEIYEKGEHHLEELWGETDGDAPLHLRELLISNCRKFQGFPKSIRHFNHLKKIVIVGGYSVTSLPDEFCLLRSLEHLVLEECARLSSLPSNFGNLSNLRHLDLSSCSELRSLPVSFKNLKLLKVLNLVGCSQLRSEDLSFLEIITKLEYVNLSECQQLEELPRHITNQASLRELHFMGSSLRELPDDIGRLSMLRNMLIIESPFTRLPTSFGGLSSLTKLFIESCPILKCLPDSLGNLSSLKRLEISHCPVLECLPQSLGNLCSLTNLTISRCPELECLPESLGNLSSLKDLEISDCLKLECLPNSLENLSSLINFDIRDCSKLKRLPDSLGDLSSLTNLEIEFCPDLEVSPKSFRQLNNLETLHLYGCLIGEVYFGSASLPSALNSLKRIYLGETEVCRISFSKDCCPHLESLCVLNNYPLVEIDALPKTLESIYLENCSMLEHIPSFAQLTSLREFQITGCQKIEKIEGLENCSRLERLAVRFCCEVLDVESLEHMQNLKQVELSASKGSVIERFIQKIKKWPDDLKILGRAVPDAASRVEPLLSPKLGSNLQIVDSISNQNIQSISKLVQKRSSIGDAFMLYFVINCHSSISGQLTWKKDGGLLGAPLNFAKGRWAWVGVFTQRSQYKWHTAEFSADCEDEDGGESEEEDAEEGNTEGSEEEDAEEGNTEGSEEEDGGEYEEVEKGLVVRRGEQALVEKALFVTGEVQTVMEAVCSLLPLFQS
ncbi:disease resistance protein TAO1 isoform X2 [Cryptomeria japonica]|uniref:disease resistance protein TAO1 isoform X2 n=1 Tax=Cryptomeria japonica TaxID=3369 RepID=UPI0027DA5488|nr:disease resistance protein TAO1 isoform X2 [Cryptomeria japonica]